MLFEWFRSIEFQHFPPVAVVKCAVVVYFPAVDEGGEYFVAEGLSFEGRPAAAIEDVFFSDLPGLFAEDADVGLVAFFEVSSFPDAEQVCGGMTHPVDDCFQPDFSLFH